MKRVWTIALGLVLVFSVVACQQPVEEQAAPEKKAPAVEEKVEEKAEEHKHEASEPTAPAGEEAAVVSPEVAAGKALFNDVNLGTAGKSCNSCHADGHDLAKAAAKHTEEGALAKVINKCVEGPLKGHPLDKDSEQMKNLTAYIHSLHQ